MKRKYTKNQKKIIVKFRNLSVRIFAGLMLLGGIVGLLFFFRPGTSTVEKRELTKITTRNPKYVGKARNKNNTI